MDNEVRKFVSDLAAYLAKQGSRLTIDADTHITDVSSLEGEILERYRREENYYHGRPITAEELLAEMKMAGVDASLIWQNPAAIRYGSDKMENYEKLYRANLYIRDTAMRFPGKFIPAGWTDPRALGVSAAIKLAETCINEWGFACVKMNPAQNAFRMHSPEAMEVADAIVAMDAMPAFHFGADSPYTPVEDLEQLARRYEGHPLLAVHMGGGGAGYVEAEAHYQLTRCLGLKYPDLKFALSARRDTHTESDFISYQAAGLPFRRNLFCASDAPYGRQTWNFGGYRCMFDSLSGKYRHTDPRINAQPDLFSEDDIKHYLGGNLAALFANQYRMLLVNS